MKRWAVLVAIGLVFVAGGGWLVYDGVTTVRSHVHGTLTIERCDAPTGTTRCVGDFRADDGYLHRAVVAVPDVPADTRAVDGWLERDGGEELRTAYVVPDRRLQIVLGSVAIAVGLAAWGWAGVDAWRRRGRPTPGV